MQRAQSDDEFRYAGLRSNPLILDSAVRRRPRAFVHQSARVAEEVAVRKEETERTETVRDTVQREEVEVTDKDGRPASIR
jgi:hypothetical protein